MGFGFNFIPRSKHAVYRLLFITLPVLYCMLYAPYGMDETDQGFITALSYRISIGETQGLDFIYVRPPLSPILHTFELWVLPDQFEFLGIRCFAILFVWLSVFFSIKTLQQLFDFSSLYISPWLLGIIAFVFSMHNYPPMPWHTIDGILFSSLGAFLVTRGKQWYWIGSGLMVLLLAALCKQPYLVVLIGGLFAAGYYYPPKSLLLGIIPFLIATGLIFMAGGIEFWDRVFVDMAAASNPGEILGPGLRQYSTGALVAILLGIGWIFGKRISKQRRVEWAAWGTLLGMILIYFGLQTLKLLTSGSFVPPGFHFSQILFVLGIFITGRFLLAGQKEMIWGLLLHITAWASGISWGYQSPVLFMVASFFSLACLLSWELDYRPPTWYFPSWAAIGLFGYFLLYQAPYRDSPRSELQYDLGDHFAKLNNIYTHQERYDKYGDLKNLAERYDSKFSVLPAMPLANYITNSKPMISVDWPHDAEMAYERGLERILQELNERRPAIFVDRETGATEAKASRKQYRSSLTGHVLDTWNLVEKTKYYDVYQHP